MKQIDIRWNALIFIGLSFFILAPSARAVFKYINLYNPAPFIIYIIISLVVFFLLIFKGNLLPFKNLMATYWFIAILLLIISAITWVAYPMADSLKLQLRGTDQDDCVIIGTSHLAQLLHPYTELSYFGNPCSPGLGMLILYLPFVFLSIYPLGAIVFAISAIYAIKSYTNDLYKAATFSIILFGTVFMFEMLVVGSDLILLGCGLTVLALQIIPSIKNKNLYSLLVFSVLTGLLSSTRVNLLMIAPLMSVFIFMHWRQGAVWFLISSLSIALLPSAYLYYLSPSDFSPLHLVGKSEKILFTPLKELGIFFTVVGSITGLYLVKKSLSHLPSALFLSLTPSLTAVSFGDLVYRDYNIAAWEGANYILPIIPLAIALMITLCMKPKVDAL